MCGCLSPKNTFLGLFLVGLLLPMYYLAPWLMKHNFDLQALWMACLASRVSLALCLSHLVGVATVAAVAWVEGKRHKIKLFWVPILVSLVAGVGAGLPLFMLMHESVPNPK